MSEARDSVAVTWSPIWRKVFPPGSSKFYNIRSNKSITGWVIILQAGESSANGIALQNWVQCLFVSGHEFVGEKNAREMAKR